MRRAILLILLVAGMLSHAQAQTQNRIVVFQSDFGLKDGAVGAMKGVVVSVSRDIRIFDITHEIPPYNIWEAAYRLQQTVPYWPAGTVFVSIVDPGVGSDRKSVVAKTKSGHFIVTPDNGTLTLIAESLGIAEVRQIDEVKNRLKNSGQSYTFHGRDVYAYTGARLASGMITYRGVGPLSNSDIVKIPYQRPAFENGEASGNIPVLDIQYGNVWTNIDMKTFEKLGVKIGERVLVKVFHNKEMAYEGTMIYGNTFSAVPEGEVVGYMNSLLNFSIGINMASFAEKFKVGSGAEWSVVLKKG